MIMPKYKLHYIGSSLYPQNIFEEEAKRMGVNRRLPWFILKHQKWGDVILLGALEKKKETKETRAIVFGYTRISGLNMNCSDTLKAELISQLDITESTTVNTAVHRRCGSYVISSSHYVKNPIEDIVAKGEKLAETRGEDIKWFFAGSFHSLEKPIIFKPCAFCRALIEVETDFEIPIEHTDTLLNFIYNYEQRRYLKKDEEAPEVKEFVNLTGTKVGKEIEWK